VDGCCVLADRGRWRCRWAPSPHLPPRSLRRRASASGIPRPGPRCRPSQGGCRPTRWSTSRGARAAAALGATIVSRRVRMPSSDYCGGGDTLNAPGITRARSGSSSKDSRRSWAGAQCPPVMILGASGGCARTPPTYGAGSRICRPPGSSATPARPTTSVWTGARSSLCTRLPIRRPSSCRPHGSGWRPGDVAGAPPARSSVPPAPRPAPGGNPAQLAPANCGGASSPGDHPGHGCA
jgi:hypothetical protein